jgi:hypothetical protein
MFHVKHEDGRPKPASPVPAEAPPGSTRERALLSAWCAATFVAGLALNLYLPLVAWTHARWLAVRPEPYVAAISALAAFSLALALRRGPAFVPELRRALAVGAAIAVLSTAALYQYIYALSSDLPSAERAPAVGDLAPDFEIVDPGGRRWSLSRFRGHPVLLVFYRGFW